MTVKGVSDTAGAAWMIALAWTAVQVASPAVAGLVVAAGGHLVVVTDHQMPGDPPYVDDPPGVSAPG